MKCKHCDGDGVIVDVEYGHAGKYGCKYCDGKGVVEPLTNEEYLRSCTTERLADVLLEHFEWGLSINAEYCFTEKYVEQNREHILKWLKQPHYLKE